MIRKIMYTNIQWQSHCRRRLNAAWRNTNPTPQVRRVLKSQTKTIWCRRHRMRARHWKVLPSWANQYTTWVLCLCDPAVMYEVWCWEVLCGRANHKKNANKIEKNKIITMTAAYLTRVVHLFTFADGELIIHILARWFIQSISITVA